MEGELKVTIVFLALGFLPQTVAMSMPLSLFVCNGPGWVMAVEMTVDSH